MIGWPTVDFSALGSLMQNYVFQVGFVAWFIAQFMKASIFIVWSSVSGSYILLIPPEIVANTFLLSPLSMCSCLQQIFTYRARKGKWRLKAMVDSGGMPSSHSSLCSVCSTLLAASHTSGAALATFFLQLLRAGCYDSSWHDARCQQLPLCGLSVLQRDCDV